MGDLGSLGVIILREGKNVSWKCMRMIYIMISRVNQNSSRMSRIKH